MRITPTHEQMDYLTSVGCSKATTRQPERLTAKSPKNTHAPPPGTGSPTTQWWVIVVVILALLLFLAGLARTEERSLTSGDGTSVDPGQAVPEADRPAVCELDTGEPQMPTLYDPIGHASPQEPLGTFQGQLRAIEQRLSVFQESICGDLANDRKQTTTKLQIIDARLDDLESSHVGILNMLGRWVDGPENHTFPNLEKATDSVAEASHPDVRVFDAEVANLCENLVVLERSLGRALILLSVVAASSLSLFAMGRMILAHRIRRVEQIAFSTPDETVASFAHASTSGPRFTRGNGQWGELAGETKVNIEPTRPKRERVPEPSRQMQTIIASARKCDHLRLKPSISANPWELGLASIRGNVRSENQDYGLCFQIGDQDVMIAADGCGGLPDGQRGAYLAVVSAAVSVVKMYGTAPRWYTPGVEHAAAKAIMAAAHRLAVEGDKLNITDVRGGLRTTLIVVVGNDKKLGYSYIGDGGGCVVSVTGEVNRFLDPQKASDSAMNVLAASLGPMMEGDPVTGMIDRRAGDIVIVGTDGVFDRVEPSFPTDVLCGCILYNGDLQKTAEHIVEELASFKDAAGYVCDDNLTLGIMGNGISPALLGGFGTPVESTPAAEAISSSAATSPSMEEGLS